MIKITYRSEPEDVSTPITFDLAFLGYTKELSVYGLRQFAENNKEQTLKFRNSPYDCELYLTDGTRIKAIGYGEERWLHGYKFDQLILFDDNRWLIEINKAGYINDIIRHTMYISNVPKEFQVLNYEDIR